MKKPVKPKAYYNDLYEAVIFFYEDISTKETVRSLKEYLNIELDEQTFNGCGGKAIEVIEKGQYIVWLKDKKEKNIPNLSHESLHITNMILHARGIPISIENDETQAYLLGWIMKTLLSKK